MRFSLIVPVLNESAILEAQLAALHQCCAHVDCELLIVDGGSSDQTVAIAQRYGRVLTSCRGRARQMNMGAAQARGDVLLFLHADTQLPCNAFMAIERALLSPAVVGGAFRLRFDRQTLPYRLVACSTNLRSRLRNIFTGDQAYFVRNSSFQAVGGYPDQHLMEDLEITRLLRQVGQFVLLDDYVTTSARRHAQQGLWKSVFFMWYLRLLYRFGISPTQLQKMYANIR